MLIHASRLVEVGEHTLLLLGFGAYIHTYSQFFFSGGTDAGPMIQFFVSGGTDAGPMSNALVPGIDWPCFTYDTAILLTRYHRKRAIFVDFL